MDSNLSYKKKPREQDMRLLKDVYCTLKVMVSQILTKHHSYQGFKIIQD